ncbi:hypothetical protein D6825_02850 [Candidatus Woesearchaeota archaeon]|nr:MAG: hypothetical protein D6825_02850 [Candidatus Woesearchaeota archaeon]
MENESQKTIALVLLGVVAIVAVVGLVLMFVRGKAATGEGIYGGAIKQVEYPYWEGRGTPRNMPGQEALWDTRASKDLTTHWNYYGAPKRNPQSDVPSALTKCGVGGFLVPYAGEGNLAQYYKSRGYRVVDTGDSKAGLCVYPNEPLVGGIAGQ